MTGNQNYQTLEHRSFGQPNTPGNPIVKYIIAGQAVLLIVLAVFLFIKTGDTDEAKERERAAEAKIKLLDDQLDSLTERVRITDEALEKADAVILGYKAEVIRVHNISRETRKTHEETNFTVQPSDSVRIRKLANHFPSILSH